MYWDLARISFELRKDGRLWVARPYFNSVEVRYSLQDADVLPVCIYHYHMHRALELAIISFTVKLKTYVAEVDAKASSAKSNLEKAVG
jgi:hypothetical protein